MSTTTVAPDEAERHRRRAARRRSWSWCWPCSARRGGGAWWFLQPASAEEESRCPGEVVLLEAIQVNLQDDHYLRIGLALQAIDEADGGRRQQGARRDDRHLHRREHGEVVAEAVPGQAEEKLEHELEEAYHGDVMGVYFTDFVRCSRTATPAAAGRLDAHRTFPSGIPVRTDTWP